MIAIFLALHLAVASAQESGSSDSSSRSEESSSKSSASSSKSSKSGSEEDTKKSSDSDPKKSDSSKTSSSSSKKSDSDKSSSSKTDSKKADSKKADPKKTDSKKSSSKDASSSDEEVEAGVVEEEPVEEPEAERTTDRSRANYEDLLQGPATALPASLPAGALPGPEESSPWTVPLWLAGFGLVAGGFWFLRKRGALAGLPGMVASSGADPLRVVSRSYVGPNTSLLLVDVQTLDGGRRRLLVGAGAGRPPSLVADLGDDVAAAEYGSAMPGANVLSTGQAPLEAYARPVERYETAATVPPAPSVTVSTQGGREDGSSGTPTGVGSPVQRFVAASRLAGDEPPVDGERDQRRRAARNLLDDVLATRGDGGQRRR
jgi:hypothetical protein